MPPGWAWIGICFTGTCTPVALNLSDATAVPVVDYWQQEPIGARHD